MRLKLRTAGIPAGISYSQGSSAQLTHPGATTPNTERTLPKMNLAEQTTFPLPAPSPDVTDFLAECAELGKSLFARLRSHFQTAPEDRSESPDTIRDLESASRILKRLQETYLAAQREMHNRNKREPETTFASNASLPHSNRTNIAPHPTIPQQAYLLDDAPIEMPKAFDNKARSESVAKTPQGQSEATTLGHGEHLCRTLNGLNKPPQPTPTLFAEVSTGDTDEDPSDLAPASLLSSAPAIPVPAPWPLPKPPSPPFRPPQTRNKKKAAHRKSKHKR